jgi:hypothetical protein
MEDMGGSDIRETRKMFDFQMLDMEDAIRTELGRLST